MSKATKRINSELKTTDTDPFIVVPFDDSNVFHLTALIFSPDNSPYEGGFTIYSIKMSEQHPFQPPEFKHLTTTHRIHPNLYQSSCGKVCLDILNTFGQHRWSIAITLHQIFHTIRSLLDNNSLQCEPGQEKSRADLFRDYDMCVRAISLQSTIDLFLLTFKPEWRYTTPIKNGIVAHMKKPTTIPMLIASANKLVDGVYNTMHHTHFNISKQHILTKINECKQFAELV